MGDNFKNQKPLPKTGESGIKVDPNIKYSNKRSLRHDIQEAADKAGITIKVRREIRRLEYQISSDEKVLAILPSTYRGERGLLVATADRVIFSFDGWINNTYLTFEYPTIIQMRWLGGFIMGRMRLYIYKSENSLKFTQVWNPVGKEFVKIVSEKTRNISNMSRDSHEIRKLVGNMKPRKYQIKPNDLIADELRLLDESFKMGDTTEKDYLLCKLALLRKMD